LERIGIYNVAGAPLVPNRVPPSVLRHADELDGLPAEQDAGFRLPGAAEHWCLLDHRSRGLKACEPADPGNREQGADGKEDDPYPHADAADGDDVEAAVSVLAPLGSPPFEAFGYLSRKLVRGETPRRLLRGIFV
jgi:hypothetical protein